MISIYHNTQNYHQISTHDININFFKQFRLFFVPKTQTANSCHVSWEDYTTHLKIKSWQILYLQPFQINRWELLLFETLCTSIQFLSHGMHRLKLASMQWAILSMFIVPMHWISVWDKNHTLCLETQSVSVPFAAMLLPDLHSRQHHLSKTYS